MNAPDDECIHGLGPVAACTICNGRDRAEQTARDQVVARFPARYESPLACGHTPDVGDVIAQLADNRFVCDGCTP